MLIRNYILRKTGLINEEWLRLRVGELEGNFILKDITLAFERRL
ncbi:unnamed protein product [Tenebrio molitor]|nr:unnamed protein product [Tenebrio molitor]